MNLLRQIISESQSKFVAANVDHGPDMIMCLVVGDSDGADDYYGVNVLFMENGRVELSTADKLSDQQAAQHKDEIIKVAKAEVMKDPESKAFLKELGHE